MWGYLRLVRFGRSARFFGAEAMLILSLGKVRAPNSLFVRFSLGRGSKPLRWILSVRFFAGYHPSRTRG